MKRTKLLLIAVLTALAGCTGTPTAPVSDSAADEAAVSKIVWDGGAESPKLSMPSPLRVSEPTVGTVSPGDGAQLAMGQLVTFDSVVVDGETGDVEASTFGSDTPNELLLVPSAANVTMLAAMKSSRVGARFLYVVPTSQVDGTAGTDTSAAPAATASKVIGISIRSATDIATTAQGHEKAPDPVLPKVKFADDGTPSIVAPKGDPGTKLASEVLIEGSGRPVQQSQSVAVKYYGWLWDGTAFDAVWGSDQAPEVLSLDGAISGWQQAIVGKKVGSRVLMVVPPALAYGGAGHGSIPPGSTLVFLVDILAAY